ncbi:amidohydrolase family protein [Thermodesulfovibrio sp. 3907-1M]|uniref:Amidohydrolase family protein n=1 Tax=Thermodesulfovibrio autotrophicus TaxID=3118333 RepID=A0AAU8GUH0_9BACT
MQIIDFHTHAFPDEIAERAIKKLEEKSQVKACLNGTLDGLLRSMDKNGVTKSVLCNIATRPEQFNSIFKWSDKIRSERIIPLPSVHPEDKEIKEHIKLIKKEGFYGIKMHPFYQDFAIDDERVYPIYEALIENDLLIVMHCGYDIAFPEWDIASAERIMNVINRFPELKFIATHLGAWKQWDDVERLMIGKPVYLEISFAFGWMPDEKIKELIIKHPSDYILFGTDSPWADQGKEIENLKKLGLAQEILEKIFHLNAENLLR